MIGEKNSECQDTHIRITVEMKYKFCPYCGNAITKNTKRMDTCNCKPPRDRVNYGKFDQCLDCGLPII